MSTASATKASDKALACKKLTALLQKDYGKSLPKLKLPVLETMLFAVCLEDNSWEAAEASYAKLMKSYFDLNEIRVSSVTEIERTLSDLKDAEWKGLRIRSILRFVFESSYTFEFEKLAKLTVESAQKRLKKIEFLSPFVVSFTLHQILGSHSVILDSVSLRAAIHLGIVPEATDIDEAAEFLKGGLKKAETWGFCHLLRKLATDPKFEGRFTETFDDEFDILRVEENLNTLKSPKKKKKAPSAPAPTKKKAKAKKTTAPAEAAPKAAASSKKTATPATAAKKTAAKNSTAKKSPPAKKASGSTKKTTTKASSSPKSQSGTKKTAVPKKKR
ncbi:MAG: hypothetical protein WAO83_12250 [Fuerstiella sp.]